jgi:hypothetical protein
VLGTVAGAHATSLDNYRDLIRPHGQKRSDAVFQATLDACYAQTGASRFHADTPAFKQCMLGRGFRWTWVRNVPEPRARASEPDTSYDPGPTVVDSPPPPSPTLTIHPLTGEVLAQ